MILKRIIGLFFILLLCGCNKQTNLPASLPEKPFLVIAHRGASAYAPDHTITSYQMAADMDANYIEIDLQMTKDGKLVALHDEVIPYAGGTRSVGQLTFDELRSVSPGNVFNNKHPVFASKTYENSRIPELQEIIDHFNGTANFYIEIKSPSAYPGIEKKLLDHLQAAGLLDFDMTLPKIIIQSFDATSLKKVSAMEPSIPLIQLYSFQHPAALTKKEIQKLKKYASGIGVNASQLTPDFIQQIQDADLHIHPYTVNDEESLQELLEIGVNGVFTDKPDIARRILLNTK